MAAYIKGSMGLEPMKDFSARFAGELVCRSDNRPYVYAENYLLVKEKSPIISDRALTMRY